MSRMAVALFEAIYTAFGVLAWALFAWAFRQWLICALAFAGSISLFNIFLFNRPEDRLICILEAFCYPDPDDIIDDPENRQWWWFIPESFLLTLCCGVFFIPVSMIGVTLFGIVLPLGILYIDLKDGSPW